MSHGSKWSYEELTRLARVWRKHNKSSIRNMFPGRTPAAIRHKAYLIGVGGKVTRWSAKEVEILVSEYPKLGAKRLHKMLPRHNPKAIYNKALLLGLHREHSYANRSNIVSRVAKSLTEQFSREGI